MILPRTLLQQAAAHWFLLLLPPILLVELAFVRSTDWSRPGPAEAVVLFDLCLFVPALFLVGHRRRLPRRALLIRTSGLFLLGLFLASLLIPEDAHVLIARLAWLRPLGLALLALAEVALFVAVIRMFLGGRASAREVAERSGTPEWVARLMLLEARFWKAVWRFIRRR